MTQYNMIFDKNTKNKNPFLIYFLSFVLVASGFFVKHVQTGLCINDTSILQSQGSWGKLFFLELSNNCLHPTAQFWFRDNGAMLNLKKQGCLAAFYKKHSGYLLDMFYLYVDAFSLDRSACAQRPDQNIYRAINQTTWGGLSVYYKGYEKSSFQTWCAVNGHYKPLAENQGIDPYVKLTTSCTNTPEKRFHFGKFRTIFFAFHQNFPTNRKISQVFSTNYPNCLLEIFRLACKEIEHSVWNILNITLSKCQKSAIHKLFGNQIIPSYCKCPSICFGKCSLIIHTQLKKLQALTNWKITPSPPCLEI